MNRREEILRAVSEAARVYAAHPPGNRTSFDIVGAVIGRGVPFLFRPLDRLWGAYIRSGNEYGILVTTQLGLPVQRFTLAHELGHFLLGHESSWDETIQYVGRNTAGGRPAAEVAADTFASELLAPKALMLESAKRKRWTRAALHDANTIYQMGLRLGVSYQAACWGLVTAGVLSRPEAEVLQSESVRECKLALAPNTLLANPWVDVWSLDKDDSGTFLEAGPEDVFAVRVEDRASAGYVWQLADAEGDVEVLGERQPDLDRLYGEPSGRTIYLRFPRAGTHRLAFEHKRPWAGTMLEHIEISVDSHGKELEGLPRRAKQAALAA